MKKKATYIVLASAIVAGAAAAPLAGAGAAVAQDAAAGQASFAKCQACHAVGLGAKNSSVQSSMGWPTGKPARLRGISTHPL